MQLQVFTRALWVLITCSAAVGMQVGDARRAVQFMLGDHLGSSSVMTDSAGNNVKELRYKPWGETRYSSGAMPTEYRFTGQYEEASIGLYFYNARWYDSGISQFNQPDTLIPEPSNPLDWNRYAYARYNPVRYSDSSGHCIDGLTTLVCITAIAMAGGAIIGGGINAYHQYQETGRVDIGQVGEAALGGAVIGGGAVLAGAVIGSIVLPGLLLLQD